MQGRFRVRPLEALDGTLIIDSWNDQSLGRYDANGTFIENFAALGVFPDKFIFHESVRELFGDCNHDGDVDLDDYTDFTSCFGGPSGGLGIGCDCFDGDGNGNVDLRDLAALAQLFDGS